MNKHLLLVPALVLGLSSMAHADVSGQVKVSLKVDSGCVVDNSKVEGNMNNFGDLNFGNSDTTWSNVLTAKVQSAVDKGDLTVTCGKDDTKFDVSIDGGLRGNRTMQHSSEPDTVAYNVYRDAARSNLYAINTPQAYTTGAANTPTAVPIYGAVPANTSPVSVGDYVDTLLVNVAF